MRIYHRLGLIRDQHERNDKPPPHIAADPAFQLVTLFRSQVQAASAPITKQSKLRVNNEAMQTFGNLASILREKGGNGMIFLIACFLEHNFGRGTVPEAEMENVRGGLSVSDIIDGTSPSELMHDEGHQAIAEDGGMVTESEVYDQEEAMDADDDLDAFIGNVSEGQDEDERDTGQEISQQPSDHNANVSTPLKRSATDWLNSNFGGAPTPPQSAGSMFKPSMSSGNEALYASSEARISNVCYAVAQQPSGASPSSGSVFGKLVNQSPNLTTPPGGAKQRPLSIFGAGGPSSAFGVSTAKNVFGGPTFGSSSVQPPLFPSAKPSNISELNAQAQTTASMSTNTTTASQSFNATPGTASSAAGSSSSNSSTGASTPQPKGPENTGSPSNFRPSPFAASFVPKALPSPTPTPSSSSPMQKASLTPIRTNSLFKSPLSSSTPITSHEGGIYLPDMSSTPPSLIFPSTPATASSLDGTGRGQGSPLSINTTSSFLKSSSSGLLRKAVAIDSPVAPPPLGRQGPISLPSTPTGMTSNGSFAIPPTPTTFPPPRGGTLGLMNMSDDSIVVVSPRRPSLPSSSSLRLEDTILADTSRDSELAEIEASPPPAAVRTKRRSEEMRSEAVEFAQKSNAVQQCFSRWRKRLADQLAWKEACNRSEVYKQRLHDGADSVASSSRYSSPALSKRRRESVEVSSAPLRTRRRRDVSGSISTVPRTDDQLAHRLREVRQSSFVVPLKQLF